MEGNKSSIIERIRKDINTLPSIEIKEHKGEDKNLYNIKIFQGEKSIIFQIEKINDFSELIYEEEYTLKELYNKNNFFKCYSSIKDIFKGFFKEFKDKEIIISENNEIINLKFEFKIIGKKQIIEFDINNYKLNNTKIILKLCNKIIEIEKLNIKLNNINNKLSKQIENNKKETDEKIKNQIEINKKETDSKIKKQITINKNETDKTIKLNIIKNIFVIIIIFLVIIDYKITKNKIDDIEINKLKFIIEKINNIENNKLNSITEKINEIENNKLNSITEKINDIEIVLTSSSLQLYNRFFDIKIFKSLVNEGIKKYFNKNISNFELLYQASIDGYGEKNFHEKCDGKNNTIVLVITDNNRIFGGFTELEWNDYGYKEGSKGFIFSINDNKIYYNKSKYQIYCNSYFEPQFTGGFSIYFTDHKSYGFDLTTNGHIFDTEEKKYALAWNYKFKIKDYAIFQIYLDNNY